MKRKSVSRRAVTTKVFTGVILAVFAAVPLQAAATPTAGLPADVVSSGKLIVGLEGTYPPFSYQNGSGQLVGFEIDFAAALAKRLGVVAAFQPGLRPGLPFGFPAFFFMFALTL